MLRRHILALAACAPLGLASCARTTTLTPTPGTQTVPGKADVAVNRVSGVEVTAQADAWRGDPSVTSAVEPVRVTITNRSDSPIRVRYADFALVAPNGHRYSALPPFDVEGELLSPALAAGYAPIVTPGFAYRRFFIAPYFARLYPGIPIWRARYYFYDPFYYNLYYHDLVQSIRPTVQMLEAALPEGVIEAGGQVSGFLYFQQLDPKLPTVTFRETLVGVADEHREPGEMLGEISIPFTVNITA